MIDWSQLMKNTQLANWASTSGLPSIVSVGNSVIAKYANDIQVQNVQLRHNLTH